MGHKLRLVMKRTVGGIVLLTMLLTLLWNANLGSAIADDTTTALTIKVNAGGTITTAGLYSLNDLKKMNQVQEAFTSVDAMPSPSTVFARGVLLTDLLARANLEIKNIQSIKLSSRDGWTHSYSGEFLFGKARYSYPNIVVDWDKKSDNPPEFLPGAEENKKPVEPILALKAFQERFNTGPKWDKISGADAIGFYFGQTGIAEMTGVHFGKWVNQVEVILKDGVRFVSPNTPETGGKDQPGDAISDNESIGADQSEDEADSAVSPDKAGDKPTRVGVPSDTLTIKVGYYGGPYYTKKVYTLKDIEAMPLVLQAYTFIDNMPAVVIDSGKGVKLTDLLADAGIDVNSVEAFYFYATDVKVGWYECLPKSYLLDTTRYYYPKLPTHWDYDTQSSVPGAAYGAIRADPIIAIHDNWQRFATSPDFSVHDTSTRFRLLFGQDDTGTRTASRSVKWVHAIEVMLGGAPPSGVTLDHNIAKLKVGSTFQLTADVAPGKATDKSVTWSSSQPNVAVVDKNGLVTIVGRGTATITVSTVVGNLTASCVVNGSNQAGAASQKNGALNTPAGPAPPKDKLRALAEKKAASALLKTISVSAKQAGSQPWRVFEMSVDAVPLRQQKDQNNFGIYATVLFFTLFFFGAGQRYREYSKEVIE